MWTIVPTQHLIRRAAKQPRRDVRELAARSWQIAPGETTTPPAACFLPGQLERVAGYEFASDNFRQEMYGGREVRHAPTMGYLIEQALVMEGVIYKEDASTFLTRRRSRIPPVSIRNYIERGAMFCTPGGNDYFGQWLIDDCVTYPMAAAEGSPLMVGRAMSEHALVYERWLEMEPTRVKAARVGQLVLFDDFGQNRHKSERFRSLTRKLLTHVDAAPHPGVFVVRGTSGSRRILRNELEIGEHLRKSRGFRVVHPIESDVPSILQACAGAQVVVGTEGSHLVHAVMLLSSGTSLLTLQPPFRFCTVLKDVADREGIKFGFVVGQPVEDDFVVDVDEIERTLDLMLERQTA